MAVVQISKIQIRRGKANSGTGLPQLASGELAWAVDTQELYIGNGSVAEGSPFVGNTKILTELDLGLNSNILDVLQYTYKAKNTAIQTGDDPNNAVQRSLQERFDDYINFNSFKDPLKPDAGDFTADLQRVIEQLFLNISNTPAYEQDSYAAAKNRVVLTLPPGIFRITDTIYIPSYTTIVGAGSDKTIIKHEGTGTVFQFIDNNATIESAKTQDYSSPLTYSENSRQPRNIAIKGITLSTTSTEQSVMQLDSVKDSVFEDMIIEGGWNYEAGQTINGITLRSASPAITCQNITFRNITISKCVCAVYLRGDSLNNTFEDMFITDVKQGVYLSPESINDQPNGPRETTINNVRFFFVRQHAIYLKTGSGNTISNIKLEDVGNDGAGHGRLTKYPQIFIWGGNSIEANLQPFGKNSVSGVISDRTYSNLGIVNNSSLALTDNVSKFLPYVPEVAGCGSYELVHPLRVSIDSNVSFARDLLRLPVNSNKDGAPLGSSVYKIEYAYNSNDFTRRGTMTVSINTRTGDIQLSDEYDFAGSDPSGELARRLEFQAKVYSFTENPSGSLEPFTVSEYTGAPGQVPKTIKLEYVNPTPDSGDFVCTYLATFIQ